MAGVGSIDRSRADAQALYYRSIPIGERAMGLGGAYTGIANDPSSTYYNPAGIVTGGRFQLMGSLSSIVFTRRKVENAFDVANIEADFTSTATTTPITRSPPTIPCEPECCPAGTDRTSVALLLTQLLSKFSAITTCETFHAPFAVCPPDR